MSEKSAETIYELGYLLKSDASSTVVLDIAKKLNLEIVHTATEKEIKLAYQIDKQDNAQFGYLHFKVKDKATLLELDKELKMIDSLLRFIVIKLPEIKEKKSKKPVASTPTAESKQESLDSLSNEKLEEKLEEFVS